MNRVLAVGLCLAVAAPLGAQEVLVTPGSRVRVTLQSAQQLNGTFSARKRDSLLVDVAGPGGPQPSWISLADVQRIERYMGKRHPYGNSILWGTVIGGGAGALLGAVQPLCKGSGFDCILQFTDRGEAVAAGAVVGGLSGILVGAIVASVGHDDWRLASLPALQPTISAGSAGFRIRFQIPVRL